MGLYEKLVNGEEKLSLVGLGYVGMPIAVAFGRKINVIGYDLNAQKVEQYKAGYDPTREVGDDVIKQANVEFTADETKLREAKFHIVAVPTPVNDDHTPDLRPVEGASRTVGRNLVKGSIVVFESTVYPGVTEDICVPIMEKESGLTCGVDFKVGYSPERINPGDKVHRLETIVKIVSGMDEETLDTIAKVYELVVEAGVYRADSIKVAEAAKVIENSQRDINIAFMNELSIIFNKLGIEMGYHSQIILSGRRINDDMGRYVAENVVKNLIKADIAVKTARVAILGFTFKENCPDTRNTKVIDIVKELREYGIEPVIVDETADAQEAERLYGVKLAGREAVKDLDALVIAVAHEEFSHLSKEEIAGFFNQAHEKKVLVDIKGILNRRDYMTEEYMYWRL